MRGLDAAFRKRREHAFVSAARAVGCGHVPKQGTRAKTVW